MNDSPSPTRYRPWFAFFALLAIVAPTVLAISGVDSESVLFSTWSDRDLHRALRLPEVPQVMGPEITGIGRSPGGAYYVLLASLLAFTHEPSHLFLASLVLTAAGLAILGVTVARTLGRFEGAAVPALGVAIVTQIAAHTFNLWNPAFVFLFVASSHALFVHALATGSERGIPWLVFVTALGAQIHLSLHSLLALELVALAIFHPGIRRRTWGLAALAFLVAFGPYLVHELGDGFANLRAIASNRRPSTRVPVVASGLVGWLTTVFGVDGYAFVPDSGPLRPRIASALASCALVVITATHYVARLAARVRRRFATGRLPREAPTPRARVEHAMAFVALVGLVVQRAGAIYEDIMMRHYLILAPSGLVLGACALRATVDRCAASSRPLVRTLGPATLALALVGSFVAQVRTVTYVLGELQPRWGLLALRELRTILNVARERYRMPPDVVATRTVLARALPVERRSDGTRGAAEAGPRYAAYDSALHLAFPTFEHPSDEGTHDAVPCLLVVVHDPHASEEGDPSEVAREVLRDLATRALPYREPREAIRRGRYTFARFDPTDGNCPRSLHHPYNASRTEERLLRVRRAIPHAGTVTLAPDLFAFRLGTLPHAPVAGVRIAQGPRGLRATLHGPALRGDGGTQSHAVVDPMLRFFDPDGRERARVLLARGTVGGAHATSATPWHSPWVAVPAGRYRLVFHARYEGSYRYGAHESGIEGPVLARAFEVRGPGADVDAP